MFHFYKLYYAILPKPLFVISFLVFIILNTIENILHYSIGRESNAEKIILKNPTKVDWKRIITIMIIFAILQALLTCIFNGC
uniref:Uncharacterized protein n=1 Tax=viral metagenome TaxID=1070528 RepID=A0A6C0CTV0_9ZZZZ